MLAAAVAKTGDMKITTPTATLGIRGTTGLVEVPEDGSATGQNNIKLYPDADGHVGRIEVNDRQGTWLGLLSQGASGFSVRPGIGGGRVSAVPLFIPPQVMQRDQGFVRQVHSTQTFGRQVVAQQRDFRRANPNFVNPNRPIRQPGQQPNGLPGQNRPGQPGQLNRPGQPNQQGLPNRQGQQQPGTPGQPGNARTGQQPGAPGQPGAGPRTGQPGSTTQPGTGPRTGPNSRARHRACQTAAVNCSRVRRLACRRGQDNCRQARRHSPDCRHAPASCQRARRKVSRDS